MPFVLLINIHVVVEKCLSIIIYFKSAVANGNERYAAK